MATRIVVCFFYGLLATAAATKSEHVLAGEKAYAKGAYDVARRHFEEAIAAGERSGEPWLYIGLILEARRQYAESIPYFRGAAERPLPTKLKKVAYWKLVILYRQAKQYGEALRYAARLEDMGEKSELFDKIRLEAENHHGKTESTLVGYSAIRKGLALEREFRKQLQEGKSLEQAAPLAQQAISEFEDAMQQNDSWREYRWKIASLYEKLKENEKAQSIYLQIWEDTHDARAAYKLGHFARRRGDYREALRHFAAALEQPADDPQLLFFIRYQAAQANYGLGNSKAAYTHAHKARRLAEELELSEKTRHGLRRIYCLAALSQQKLDKEFCRFSRREEHPLFYNLVQLKTALAENDTPKALRFAARIYETEATDETENARFPAYAMADLPLAIGVLFQGERYRDVLELTERFRKILEQRADYHGWRAVSYFALKEYGSACIEFAKIQNPTPSQMNLHLIALAHTGDFGEVRKKAELYLRNDQARPKLTKSLRTLRLFAPLRQEPDFEDWLRAATSGSPSRNGENKNKSQ
ncbi:MAG: tetratricopeptide repeat protein [Turneriella sp.]|nr:tetratricopeptide repeat protein [Leptospiraceae bacterium]MCX7633415.1 tetratricopeptide repeat protein [Turneriella sp.]